MTGINMTEFSDIVDKQRIILKAEELRDSIENMHIHGLSSMWYDNRPQDTEGNKTVTDITYMDDRIERTLPDGTIIIMQQGLKGRKWLDKVERIMLSEEKKF